MPFSCGFCGKRFGQKATLVQHQLTHTGQKPFRCPDCSLRFSRKSNMTRHINAIHLKTRPYTCKYCNKRFARNSNKTRHESTHLNDEVTGLPIYPPPKPRIAPGKGIKVDDILKKHGIKLEGPPVKKKTVTRRKLSPRIVGKEDGLVADDPKLSPKILGKPVLVSFAKNGEKKRSAGGKKRAFEDSSMPLLDEHADLKKALSSRTWHSENSMKTVTACP